MYTYALFQSLQSLERLRYQPMLGSSSWSPVEKVTSNSITYIIGIVVAVLLLVLIAVAFYCYWRKKNRHGGNQAYDPQGKKKIFFWSQIVRLSEVSKGIVIRKRLGLLCQTERRWESCESNDLMRRKIAPTWVFLKTLRRFPNSHLLSGKTTKDKFCVVRQRESWQQILCMFTCYSLTPTHVTLEEECGRNLKL